MDRDDIRRQKQEVIKRFGEWTAHNIQLAEDVYTIGERIAGDEIKLRRVVQTVSDMAGKPFGQLRVLDLACLEGLYTMEFARHGAEVVAIEGRTANIEKARFAAKVLSLTNVDFFQDDVRNLSADKYGRFDVVLCLGILYHLEVPDVFSFLGHVFEVCDGFAVIDTHVSLGCQKSCVYSGKEYWGREFTEHHASSSLQERERSLWASLDNTTSFWFTRPSLLNLLSHIGFTSVYECHIPGESGKPANRLTLVAIKGQREQLVCCPLVNTQPSREIPEKPGHRYAERLLGLWHQVGPLIPRRPKEIAKKMLYPRRSR